MIFLKIETPLPQHPYMPKYVSTSVPFRISNILTPSGTINHLALPIFTASRHLSPRSCLSCPSWHVVFPVPADPRPVPVPPSHKPSLPCMGSRVFDAVHKNSHLIPCSLFYLLYRSAKSVYDRLKSPSSELASKFQIPTLREASTGCQSPPPSFISPSLPPTRVEPCSQYQANTSVGQHPP